MSESAGRALWVWRHPRPQGAAGRCIGAGSNLPVHWRRAKRLARRIQAHARRQRLPHQVQTSPLARCADVGRWLRRWGWQHRLDSGLLEIDFGAWDGQSWDRIGQASVEVWVADFLGHAPAGGESLQQLLHRVAAWQPGACCVVSHGGWMLARRWLLEHGGRPPSAFDWPAAPGYGEVWRLA